MQEKLPVRFLSLLAEGGIRSLSELARRLDVSEGLLRLMAENLARQGYLAPLGDGCTTTSTTACDGCALSDACSPSGSHASKPLRLMLTPKGRQAATPVVET